MVTGRFQTVRRPVPGRRTAGFLRVPSGRNEAQVETVAFQSLTYPAGGIALVSGFDGDRELLKLAAPVLELPAFDYRRSGSRESRTSAAMESRPPKPDDEPDEQVELHEKPEHR
jgi:hypothetical protein